MRSATKVAKPLAKILDGSSSPECSLNSNYNPRKPPVQVEKSNYIGEKEELEDRISLLSNIEGVSNAINRSSLLLDSEDGIINNLTSIIIRHIK